MIYILGARTLYCQFDCNANYHIHSAIHEDKQGGSGGGVKN